MFCAKNQSILMSLDVCFAKQEPRVGVLKPGITSDGQD